MAERLKSLDDKELWVKYISVKMYLNDIRREMKIRNISESNSNTFPMSTSNIGKNVVTKEKTKKIIVKTKRPSTESEPERNRIPIKSTMKIIKKVLTDKGIAFKSSSSKDELITLVRQNNLVRKCNEEAIKAKK